MDKNLIKNIEENKFFRVGDTFYDIDKIENDHLIFCTFGGGFQTKISLNDKKLNKDFYNGDLTFFEKVPYIYQSVELYLEGWKENENLKAYNLKFHNWNGWSHCYAPLDQVIKFNEYQKNSEHGLANGLYEDTDIFKIIDDETITIKEYEQLEANKMELITIKSDIINYNGKDIKPKVFDLMSANWCWIQA